MTGQGRHEFSPWGDVRSLTAFLLVPNLLLHMRLHHLAKEYNDLQLEHQFQVMFLDTNTSCRALRMQGKGKLASRLA